MKTIKVIQAPVVLFFDEKEGREMESIISIDGREIKIKASEGDYGSSEDFFDVKENKKIILSMFEPDDDEIRVDNDILELLSKLAGATLYDELGQEGEEFTSEEVLSWEF